jgi:hypothetical protein
MLESMDCSVFCTWFKCFDGNKSGHAAQEAGQLTLIHFTKGALTQLLIWPIE